jgi:ABC-2 type transport system permease protein
MKQLLIFVRKEFYHVLRDKKVLFILFGMPIAQVLLFGFALSSEVKNSRVAILDQSKDVASEQLTAKIEASRYFDLEKNLTTHQQMEAAFQEGKIKAAVVFPANFREDLQRQNNPQVQLIIDATDINTGNLVNSYLSAIIADFQAEQNPLVQVPYRIGTEIRMLYNPQLKGAPNFVPGVMAMVMLLVCVMMTAIAIVKEKETGTMEVLLVSPMRPSLVIISKAIPYLVLSLVNLGAILLLSVFVLDVPVKGSLPLLLAVSTLFIITCLALGILISIQTSSQQVAMLISLMGMMLPTLMLSGFMFPIENMPAPLQVISNIIPAKWYYIIVKSIMIKGAGFAAIWKETMILLGITLVFFAISIKKFNIRLQ